MVGTTYMKPFASHPPGFPGDPDRVSFLHVFANDSPHVRAWGYVIGLGFTMNQRQQASWGCPRLRSAHAQAVELSLGSNGGIIRRILGASPSDLGRRVSMAL